jgi:hypothetical protein
MKLTTHRYLDDPVPTSLHRGAERLAIESALDDARLARRGTAWRSVRRHLPRLRH